MRIISRSETETSRSIDLYSVHGLGPKIKNTQGNQRRQRESDAGRLPLLKSAIRDTLALVHLGRVTGRLKGVAGGGQGFEVGAVLFLRLRKC